MRMHASASQCQYRDQQGKGSRCRCLHNLYDLHLLCYSLRTPSVSCSPCLFHRPPLKPFSTHLEPPQQLMIACNLTMMAMAMAMAMPAPLSLSLSLWMLI